MNHPQSSKGIRFAHVFLFILCACMIYPKPLEAWKTHDSWEALARRAGTDKIVNKYETVYEMWLAPWRHEAVNFLEIGLGCDMQYGPGKSLTLWESYFTHRDARVSFLEVDGACVRNHGIRLRNGTIFVGSQEDESVLQKISVEGHAHGGYDVIVDDGGHTMSQQLASIEALWPVLSSGGLYVIEDLVTSYDKAYGGGPRNKPGTAVDLVKGLIDHVNCEYNDIDCAEMHLDFIYCVRNACALGKKNLKGKAESTAHEAVVRSG